MSLLNKIFSLKENDLHYLVKFFGIKFKFKALKLTNKRVKKFFHGTRSDLMDFWHQFIWLRGENLTYKEKRWILETKMYEKVGYFPNLDNPKSFNEKLNWMKLHYCHPIAPKCVDKYEFKKYIKEKLGEGYTVPYIGVFDHVNDIDFDSLPDQFVAKSTLEGAGKGVFVIKDKSKTDFDKLKYLLNHMLMDWNTCYYSFLVKNNEGLKPRIIIEQYVEQTPGELYDYKFYCFHGEPKFLYAGIESRFSKRKRKISFYDLNWKELPIKIASRLSHHNVPKPKFFDEMLRISKLLAKDFPFVRVDFYEVGEKVYVGELTFNPWGGFAKYLPREWDYIMGEWLDLSKLEKQYLLDERSI